MELNDNKAGMEGLDKDKINSIIDAASRGSKFYAHQQKKEAKLRAQIEKYQRVLAGMSDADIIKAEKQCDRILQTLEESRDLSQCIVHVDMDAFYAAAEMRDDSSLRDRPMAVGGNDMLSTSNYIARRFGVRAAMPGFIAKKLCPELVIVPCNFQKYKKIAANIRSVMAQFDPDFVPMSLDEAYLNITQFAQVRLAEGETEVFRERRRYTGECVCYLPRYAAGQSEPDPVPVVAIEPCPRCQRARGVVIDRVSFGNSVEEIANEMRFLIEQKTGLTASAGIAANGMLAKICSDRNKPDGQFYLKPDKKEILAFTSDLPIRKIPGIGKVTDSILKGFGMVTCADVRAKRGIIHAVFTENLVYFILRASIGVGSGIANGGFGTEDNSERKSMSVERTFSDNGNVEELIKICQDLCKALVVDLEKKQAKGKCVTLKIKTADFSVRTRAHTVNMHVATFEDIFPVARTLLCNEITAAKENGDKLTLRLMGVRMSQFATSADDLASSNQRTLSQLFGQPSISSVGNCNNNDGSISNAPKVDPSEGCRGPSDTPNRVPIARDPSCSGDEDEFVSAGPDTYVESKKIKTDSRPELESDQSKRPASSGPSLITLVQKTVENRQKVLSDDVLLQRQRPRTAVESSVDPSCSAKPNQSVNESALQPPAAKRPKLAAMPSSPRAETNRHPPTTVAGGGTAEVVKITRGGRVLELKPYFCPVCNHQLMLESLGSFNGHLDSCLSRSTIKEVISEENCEANGGPAPDDPPQRPPTGKLGKSNDKPARDPSAAAASNNKPGPMDAFLKRS